jgi:putative DNA primase/helicase
LDFTFDQKLDSNRNLIGVKNGVVDLSTGEVRERKYDDFVNCIVPVEYNPNIDTAWWERVVLSMMAQDPEMTEYLQKLLGYFLTGETSEQIFVIFHGEGGNGKGIVAQTITRLMGDLAKAQNKALIFSNHKAGNKDAEKAELKGTRFAIWNEPSKHDVLDTSAVQELTGEDTIRAAKKYHDPCNITPYYKCLLLSNWLPDIAPVNDAIARRLIAIPFPVTFTQLLDGEEETPLRQQMDCDLKKKIDENMDVVFAWMVQGAVKWYASKDLKRNAPGKVKAYTRQYLDEMDKVKIFINEHCEFGRHFKVLQRDLGNKFEMWLLDDDAKKWDKRDLYKCLDRDFGIKSSTIWFDGKTSKGYNGIRLIQEEQAEACPEQTPPSD